jgi:hypothetical protein
MTSASIRSRICNCGKVLLLELEFEDKRVSGVALTPGWEQSTVAFMCDSNNRKSRKIRSSCMGRAYVYCKACKRRVQIRTFDTLEKYLPDPGPVPVTFPAL